MRIGIDLDNTIICYDRIFHAVAQERGLIPASVPSTKSAVRDHLRQSGREESWVELQGYVYGPALLQADAFPGVWDFFRACAANHIGVSVVSHKTRNPAAGPKYDLHESALAWLKYHFAHQGLTLDLKKTVYLEESRASKLARIGSLACDWFIDDLPEFLAEPAFPPGVNRILFDPSGLAELPTGARRATAWPDITAQFFERPS